VAKYVTPWNVGGGMKANAYYGTKLLTRRKRKRQQLPRKIVLEAKTWAWIIIIGMVFFAMVLS